MNLSSEEKQNSNRSSVMNNSLQSNEHTMDAGNTNTVQLKESLESNLEKKPKNYIGSPKDNRERARIQKRMERQHRKDMKHANQSRENAMDGKKVKYDFKTGKELSPGRKEYYKNHPTYAQEDARRIERGVNTSTGKLESEEHLSNFIERQKGESVAYEIEFERYDDNLNQDGLCIMDMDQALDVVQKLVDKINEKPGCKIEIVPNVFFPDGDVDKTFMKKLLLDRGKEIKKLIVNNSKIPANHISINIGKSTFDQTTDVIFNLSY